MPARLVRSTRTVAFLMLALGIASAVAGAAPPAEPSGAGARAPIEWKPAAPPIPWGRVIGGTSAVIALICGGVYLLKRFGGGGLPGRGGYLEVIESRPAGRNVQLLLVKVGRRVLLLASCGGSVARIAELSEDELPSDDAPGTTEGFRALLQRLTGAAR